MKDDALLESAAGGGNSDGKGKRRPLFGFTRLGDPKINAKVGNDFVNTCKIFPKNSQQKVGRLWGERCPDAAEGPEPVGVEFLPFLQKELYSLVDIYVIRDSLPTPLPKEAADTYGPYIMVWCMYSKDVIYSL